MSEEDIARNPYLSPAPVVGSVDDVVKPVPAEIIIPTPGFRIEDLSDRYRLHDVSYLGEPHVVDMRKKLLDYGKSHDQDEWVEQNVKDVWKFAVLICTLLS